MIRTFVLTFLLVIATGCHAADTHLLQLTADMFHKVVEGKNAALIPKYYHKDLELISNDKEMDFQSFRTMQENLFKSPIQYKIVMDNDASMESGNKVAVRAFIATKMPDEDPRQIVVMFIAEFKDNKFYRIWEVSYPDYSNATA